MKSLTKKQMELFRQFHRLKLYSPDNRAMQTRYEDILKLVARHFPMKSEADREQFKQILILLRELKDREMTAEQLKRGLSESLSKRGGNETLVSPIPGSISYNSNHSLSEENTASTSPDSSLTMNGEQKFDTNQNSDKNEDDKNIEYFDFASIGIDIKSLDSRYETPSKMDKNDKSDPH